MEATDQELFGLIIQYQLSIVKYENGWLVGRTEESDWYVDNEIGVVDGCLVDIAIAPTPHEAVHKAVEIQRAKADGRDL